MAEQDRVMSAAELNNLSDSQFAFVEDGGIRDPSGKTAPRNKRHFAINDAAAVRRSLTQAVGSPFGRQALPKLMTAARKFGVTVGASTRSMFGEPELDGYPERRFTRFPPEIRNRGNGNAEHIFGYAACFGKLSRKLGGFVEQVGLTAFNEARTDNWPDVICRYNHHDDMLLGTTHARTLTLAIDETGLAYDVEPPQARSDVLEYVRRGDVRHSSFAFRVYPGGDSWGVSEFNYPMRTLHSIQLVDVAPVLDPAYPDATAGARALNGAVESLASWVQGDPEEVRSILADGRAMEFFKKTKGGGGGRDQRRPAPKPTLTGAQALIALQGNQADPWADED